MEDFFNRLDEAKKEKNKLENEREQQNIIKHKIAEDFAKQLSEFLKPYISQFEDRNYRCTEKQHYPYYNLRVGNLNNNVEIAIVNSQLATGFELAAFADGQPTYAIAPQITNYFNKKEVEKFVHQAFAPLIEN